MDNKIFVNLNFNEKTITFDHAHLTAKQSNLSFKIIKGENPENLKFGFKFYEGAVLKSEEEYYYGNAVVAPTWSIEPPIDISVLVKHQITVWMEINGERIENSYTVENILPPQPFPSWSWNSITQTWEAPIPHPDNNQPLGWDESRKSWVLRTL